MAIWLSIAAYFAIGVVFMLFFSYLVGRHTCPWHSRTDRIPCTFHFELEFSAMVSLYAWSIVLFAGALSMRP